MQRDTERDSASAGLSQEHCLPWMLVCDYQHGNHSDEVLSIDAVLISVRFR